MDASIDRLIEPVEREFARLASGLDHWPDPHPRGVPPADDEYSRVTNPERYRILGARIDAWEAVVVAEGLATIERDVPTTSADTRGAVAVRADRWLPRREGALSLVVARTDLAGVAVGVVLSVGDPPTVVAMFPRCGCDACDGGSEREIEELDRHVLGVVRGTFRHLTQGDFAITVIDASGWSASNMPRRLTAGDGVDAILADPTGWDEVSGSPWCE